LRIVIRVSNLTRRRGACHIGAREDVLRLVLISNRVAIPTESGPHRAGGLEVALAPTLKRYDGIWFGWSGNIVPRDQVVTTTLEKSSQTFVLADLSEEDYQEYYSGFANRVLWPILHYRIDLAEFKLRDLTGYLRVNQYFADELSKVIQPSDLLWVHDYHFIPLGDELRKRGHTNRIGFFLHVPFPAPEFITVLPHHEQLLGSLLQYDLVGFQTEQDVQNFVRYAVDETRGANIRVFQATDRQVVLNKDGREIRVGAFPVGIDTSEFERRARRATQSAFVQQVVQSLEGRSLMIGADRLDYSKGLTQRMEAVGLFFEHWPHWRGKVTYLQIAPKSRSEIQEYHELGQAIDALAGGINGKFGEASWTPIRYVNRAYSRSVLAGLYRAARVGLVTPLRDGMNLVAKEYVAAQDPNDPGVLILSRFAGAAAECRDALLVNPYDSESVASAIAQALEMPLSERRDRHGHILATLAQNSSDMWGARFLQSLEQVELVGSEADFWHSSAL
jgi:trehalose 6-phosphate synthase